MNLQTFKSVEKFDDNWENPLIPMNDKTIYSYKYINATDLSTDITINNNDE